MDFPQTVPVASVKASVVPQSNRVSGKSKSAAGRAAGGRGYTPHGGKSSNTSAVVSRMKGIDSKLAQTILDELVEQ